MCAVMKPRYNLNAHKTHTPFLSFANRRPLALLGVVHPILTISNGDAPFCSGKFGRAAPLVIIFGRRRHISAAFYS